MRVTKRKKCLICEAPVTETRDFLVTIDLFDPEPKTLLKGELLVELKKWRAKKAYCADHIQK